MPLICPRCGSKVNEGDSFCSKCGAILPRNCPYCGIKIDLDERYCHACGKKLPFTVLDEASVEKTVVPERVEKPKPPILQKQEVSTSQRSEKPKTAIPQNPKVPTSQRPEKPKKAISKVQKNPTPPNPELLPQQNKISSSTLKEIVGDKRSSRREYAFFFGIYVLFLFACEVFKNIFQPFPITVAYIVSTVTFMRALSKRFHDLNMSGTWSLVALVPLVGLIAEIILLFTRGTEGDNDYGPDPLA